MSHMDAVLYYCEKNDLEPDIYRGRLITKGLKEKIDEANARDLNFLEKNTQQKMLPI